MKVLRSGWVTGLLVLVAVGVVFYQVFLPYWQRGHPVVTKNVTPEPVRPPSVNMASQNLPPVAPKPTVVPSTNAPMDSNYIVGRFPVWLDSPARDPFMFVEQNPEPDRAEAPSPIQQWKLHGIWRQTGSRLAAINSGIYKEGDQIDGYTVERIDIDQVWFRGTNRIEHLGFSSSASGKAMPAPPPQTQPHSGMHKRAEPIEMPAVRPGLEHTVGPRL